MCACCAYMCAVCMCICGCCQPPCLNCDKSAPLPDSNGLVGSDLRTSQQQGCILHTHYNYYGGEGVELALEPGPCPWIQVITTVSDSPWSSVNSKLLSGH